MIDPFLTPISAWFIFPYGCVSFLRQSVLSYQLFLSQSISFASTTRAFDMLGALLETLSGLSRAWWQAIQFSINLIKAKRILIELFSPKSDFISIVSSWGWMNEWINGCPWSLVMSDVPLCAGPFVVISLFLLSIQPLFLFSSNLVCSVLSQIQSVGFLSLGPIRRNLRWVTFFGRVVWRNRSLCLKEWFNVVKYEFSHSLWLPKLLTPAEAKEL